MLLLTAFVLVRYHCMFHSCNGLHVATRNVSSGDETAGAERCEEEEDQTFIAEEDQTTCMAKADQTACMDQEDEPAWLEEEDQTDKGEQGEGPKTEEEGQNAMVEQDQTAVVNKDFSLGQDVSKDKGKCQEGTLDKEEDGKGRGDQPTEAEDKEAEDEPEEVLDSRTPSRSASLARQFSRPPDLTALATEHL